MTGNCHEMVALIALAAQDPDHRGVLTSRWSGIEAGSIVDTEFASRRWSHAPFV